jgi:hypothetical protein
MPTRSTESAGLHPLRIFALAVVICIGLYAIGVLLNGSVNLGASLFPGSNPASIPTGR